LVADADPAVVLACRNALDDACYHFAQARTGRLLGEFCEIFPPDLIVTELNLPDGPALPAVAAAVGGRRVPVIVIAADCPVAVLDSAGDLPVMAVLVKPVVTAALASSVLLAVRRFAETEALRNEAADLRQRLEECRIIERAEGVVTRRLGLRAIEAYQHLHELSDGPNVKAVDLARHVLQSEGMFGDTDRSAAAVPMSKTTDHRGPQPRSIADRPLQDRPGAADNATRAAPGT
jgi:response regulator NasT